MFLFRVIIRIFKITVTSKINTLAVGVSFMIGILIKNINDDFRIFSWLFVITIFDINRETYFFLSDEEVKTKGLSAEHVL